MSKENLDNFFQQKANERSFEFEDDYWTEMELLLEDEDDNKTPLPFWWQNGRLLLGSLIAVIAIGALYMMLKQNPKQSNTNNSKTSIQNQNTTNSKVDNETRSTLNANTSNEGLSSLNANNTKHSSTNNNTNTLDNHSSNTKKPSRSTSSSSNYSNKNNQNRNTVNYSQRNSTNKNNRPKSGNTNVARSNNTSANSPDFATTVSNNNRNSKNDFNNNKTTTSNTSSSSNPFSGKEGDISNTSSTDHKTDRTLNRDVEKTLSEKTIFNFLDLIDLSEIDAVLNQLKTKIPKPDPGKSDPPLSIAIGIHAGVSRYFHNKDFQNQQPYSPALGVYANFPLSKNLSLEAGLNYWTRSNIDASLSGDSTFYNFDFQQTTTTEFVSKATYLEVPLSLKYRIREKHIAEIGGNFSYLLTASGSKSEIQSNDFETTEISYNVTNGYKKWLNSYDIALRLGYHYQWNERGTVGVQRQYGLTDITPDDVYTNITFDRNHQFKVIIGYDLIRISTNKK